MMTRIRRIGIHIGTTAVLLSLAAHSSAEVRLPAIFGDHMVLQRNAPVPVCRLIRAGASLCRRQPVEKMGCRRSHRRLTLREFL